MPAIRRVLLFLLAILLLLLFLAVPGVSWAQAPDTALDAAARQLARKITAALPPREAIVLILRNLSSLNAAETAAVRRALESELQARGVRLVEPPVEHVDVRVSLSENLDSYVWIADFTRGETSVVAMVAAPRPPAWTLRAAGEWAIQKQLIWEQEEQILDLGLLDPLNVMEQRMVVLEPARIALYDRIDGQWKLRQGLVIPVSKPWPRDTRGQFYLREAGGSAAEGIVISLPGAVCVLALRAMPEASSLNCEQTEKTAEQDERMLWLETAGPALVDGGGDFVPARNFYSGKLYGESGWRTKVEPYFSTAFLEVGSAPHLIANAGVDGRIRLYEDLQKPPVATLSGWGSDLTSVKTGCGSAWQVLATSSGDWTKPDVIQAYEIRNLEAVPVGQPVSFPGPVTALGPAAVPRLGGIGKLSHDAVAVVRNLQTGNYEAYQLSITCGR
jgi:hypothetical protein